MCNYDKMCPNDMEMWWSETIIKLLLAPNLNRRELIFQGRLTRFYEPKLRWKRSSKSHKFSSEQTFESDKNHGQVWKWNITVWLSAVLEPNGPWWYLWCHFEGILAWECRKLGKISQFFHPIHCCSMINVGQWDVIGKLEGRLLSLCSVMPR